ncbi:CD225/dispanin family protein [Prevotella communis]|uniref:CD225/dispanin family protein n=1 Tax=Prevotella communis TaxID=2913614 RepID=UPI001EDB7F62|nr:CD225/dispanin family protein [Prevotella communis]UKK69052.1 CD225/dispanin family protein [Prevotella communis]UKK71471.1 CD225/dispanin family protein [Prevotella communis]
MEYNNQENTFVPQPKDYKVWSIVNLVISILFCCQCLSIASLVLSIIALMKSNDVNKYNMMGESSAILAQDASKTAKTLNIISSILLAVNFAIDIVYMLIWGIAGIAEAMQH